MFDGGSKVAPPDEVVVTAVDRTGNESAMATAVSGKPPAAKPAPAKNRRLKGAGLDDQPALSTFSSDAELMQ